MREPRPCRDGVVPTQAALLDGLHEDQNLVRERRRMVERRRKEREKRRLDEEAAAAANAVLDVLLDDNILENVNVMGHQFKHALDTKFGQHTHVGDIRGRGLFYGLELVEERETKEPFSLR